MKIAGRKNDGAWYRANLVIKGLNSTEKDALKTLMAGLTHAGDYLGIVQDFYTAAGLTDDVNYPDDIDTLMGHYSQFGIPRQVWMGVLSYDIYDRTGSSGDYTYTAQHQADAFVFGKEIRKLMKDFTFARRQAKDLTNVTVAGEGNPGGIADATPDGLVEG